MAKNIQLTNLAANAEVDAVAALCNDGFIDLYDGAQPATGDTPVTTQQLLASCVLGNPAFGAGVNGVAAMLAPALGMGAITGDATWYRIWRSDHSTPVQDGSVGTSNANLVSATRHIVAAAPVRIDTFQLTAPKQQS